MEVEDQLIYDLINREGLKIEKVVGLENKIRYWEINQNLYKDKYTMLVLKNECARIDELKGLENRLLKIGVNFSTNL